MAARFPRSRKDSAKVDVTAESEEEAERLLLQGFEMGAFKPNEDEFALQKVMDT